jgi:hypothetical protein
MTHGEADQPGFFGDAWLPFPNISQRNWFDDAYSCN